MVLVMALAVPAAAQTRKRSAPKKPAAKAAAVAPVRTKVAEGKYVLRAQAGAVLQTWEEPWTLYKTRTGFEIEEEWRAAREGAQNSVVIDVLLVMAPGMYPTQARVGSALSPNQLDCYMTMAEFRCTAAGKTSSMPMSGAYNFFLPSPWLLSSIGRRAPKKPDQPVKVKLVQMAGMNPEGPRLIVLEAEVTYVGEDQVDIAGQPIPASIYEIRGTGVPSITVWISPDGVVLMMQDVAKPDQRMELVEFKKLSSF